ncbi:cation diffusion facilitator family transporter [Pedococcus cremeus]|uniref:Cation diffusion facilitator family transporter n=1 Tax=Pedococcus cremeus TaxID=587636 RepID=A0A1H9V2X8_9MICO|nr:cation diffusion facilitator family transporter [Pedococcus cremeus]SES16180.1 cation diffusion facilitator family transporter [Pedococcus cremeus]
MTSRSGSQPGRSGPADLTRFAWLSVAAALTTLALKATAAWLTGSVGLLSDAAESVVNLVAALVALLALRIAARPPDAGHNFGHGKAEYLSASVEAVMIFVAAVAIMLTAVLRLLQPEPLENVGAGLLVSAVAGVVNGAVALTLTRAGRRNRSLALTADGKHLMTDVWTSVGVIVGVGLVVLTGNLRVDPVVALLVGANIVVSGLGLLKQAIAGLMDKAIPDAARADVERVLDDFARRRGISVHALTTRAMGRIHLVSVHLVVPAEWTVERSHALTLDLESEVSTRLQDTYIQTHVEPSGQHCPERTL